MKKKIFVLMMLIFMCGFYASSVVFAAPKCEFCGGSMVRCCDNGYKCSSCAEKDHTTCHTHSYSDATCTSPKKCSCGATSGTALGHNWQDATCTSPKKCSRCGITTGTALGHTYEWDGISDNVTKTTHGMICVDCLSSTTTENHTNVTIEYENAGDTCLWQYNCSTCGSYLVVYESHQWGEWSSEGYGTDKKHTRSCSNCGRTESGYHSYGSWYDNGSTGHRQDCTTSGCPSYGYGAHSGGTATCNSLARCTYCSATYGDYGDHSPQLYWSTTEEQHYKNCTVCSIEIQRGNHVDSNSDGKCDVCEYVMQRPATITLNPSTTLTLEYGTTDKFTYTYNGDGTLRALVGSTTIATVSLNTSNKTITVTPVSVGETTLTLSAGETNKFFAASATATIKVTYGKVTLPSSISFVYNGKTQYFPTSDGYTVTGTASAINVGTYTVNLSLSNNYAWTDNTRIDKTVTWKITQKSINSSDITKTVNPSSYTYDGSSKTPAVTLRDTSRNAVLVAGTDYEITGYGENTKAGNPVITIVGKGNYNDTTTATFEIKPKNLNSSDIVATLSETRYEYDKTAKKPTVTLKDGEKILDEGVDYRVTYTNNTEVGTAIVTIQGIGNYTGTITKTFIIEDTTPPTVPVITAKYNSSSGSTYNSGVWTNQNVYISLLSTDLSGIAKYQYQEGGTSGTWQDMPDGGTRIWTSTIDKTVYFRAMDKHGNYSQTSNITIRIDKILPNIGTVKATLRTENGANYTWGTNTDKSVYIKIDNVGNDIGGSGLKETTYKVERIDSDTNNLLETIKEKETAVTTLVKNGTYRIVVTTEDNAGNKVESQAYIVKIEKYFVNTVKISNVYDVGSGIKEIEIKALKEGETTPQYEEILKTNEANINKRIKLTDGTFTITVKIRDKVGNEKTLTQTLTNIVY